MRTTVVIPTTGQHPDYLHQALIQLTRQTRQPDETRVCEHHDKNRNTLADNYRNGYENASGELVIFWEHDDYYEPDYIETMVREFENDPSLQILGTHETTYYHLALKKYKHMTHLNRSSAMNTVIRSGIKNLPWEGDQFLDLRLWKMVQDHKLKGKTIPGGKTIGIKHGEGITAGKGHLIEFPYNHDDPEMEWLKERTNPFSFLFYKEKSLELSKNL